MGEIKTGPMPFGKWLRQERRALDLTQQAFADQVGCARITLRRVENGVLKPSKELASILVDKIGIPAAERSEWVSFARGLSGLPRKHAQPAPFPARERTNLPTLLAAFIGREKELTEVINLVHKHRLVTLTGSGGVGKTRLSLQAANALRANYPLGVWLVELAPLVDPDLVAQAVCAVIGVRAEGNLSARDALLNYLQQKEILLVLDNCEHLIDACARFCTVFLQACPNLRIIASSREALRINGEIAYRVPSLSLPDSKKILKIVQESEAVRLFVERARAVRPEFELDESNAAVVAQICQRLDGIALAIELAASRLRLMPVDQIAARLDDTFRLLTDGSRSALPRQQTLRALIDWSYRLLSQAEQIFLQQLSIFMGGWTLEAAEAICGSDDTLELLTLLVDKSLVVVYHKANSDTRYSLLETVRQYAREKLVEPENPVQLKDRHLDYFLKLSERIAPGLSRREMAGLLNQLEMDYANFQAALEWAAEGSSEAGLRLANSLFTLWHIRGGYRSEGLEWFEKFLQKSQHTLSLPRAVALLNYYNLATNTPGSGSDTVKIYLEESFSLAARLEDDHFLAVVLGAYGSYALFNGEFDSAQAFYEQSLNKARIVKDNRLIGIGLYRLGQLAWYRQKFASARSLFEDCLVFLGKAGDLSWWALGLNFLGLLSTERSDWAAAHNYFSEALSLAQEAHDLSYVSFYLTSLGFVALGSGGFDQALSFLEQGRDLVQDTPEDRFLYKIRKGFGEIARFQGNFDLAADHYLQALALPQWETDKANTYCLLAEVERLRGQRTEAQDHLLVGLQLLKTQADWIFSAEYVLPYIACYAADSGMPKQAAACLSWVEEWNKTNGRVHPPVYQMDFERRQSQTRQKLTAAEYQTAWAEGQALNQEQILALARDILH